MQDFMRLYSGLVEKCFMACAQDFTSKSLSKNEVCRKLSGLSLVLLGYLWRSVIIDESQVTLLIVVNVCPELYGQISEAFRAGWS